MRLTVALGMLGLLASCTGSPQRDDGLAGGSEVLPSTQTTPAGPSSEGLIAFSTQRRGQVVVTRPDGSQLRELVSSGACCTAVSPDGKKLVFLALARDSRETAAVMNVDGTERRLMELPADLNLVPGVWAPDGTSIALAGYSPDVAGLNGVYLAPEPGGALVRFTRAPGNDFDLPISWSPDRSSLLFMRVEDFQADPFVGDLFAASIAGGDPVRLNPEGSWVRYVYVGPGNYFPDSTHVVFAAMSGDGGGPTSGRVVVAAVDGSLRTTITSPGIWTTSAHVSPDGSWIVFDQQRSDANLHDVFLVHPDGSGLHRVASIESGSCCAIWSPDGTRLLFSHGNDEATNLWVAAVDGSSSVELTAIGGDTFVDYSWAGPSADQ